MQKAKREILISSTPYDKRIAIVENGQLSEIVSENLETERVLGNIYKGVVQKVLPGLQAAFVELGLEKAGFLHVDDVIDRNVFLQEQYGDDDDEKVKDVKPTIDKLLKSGQEIIVQITKEPISTKGARLTTHLTFPDRFLVCMPGTNFIGVSKKERDYARRRDLKKFIRTIKSRNVGYIVRTNGLGANEKELEAQMKTLEGKWATCQKNIEEGVAPCVALEESNSAETTLRDYFSESTDFVYIDNKEEYTRMKNYLTELSPDKAKKVKLWSSNDSLFETFGIEEEYERTLHSQVKLKRGGYLVIDQTEALVAIDINTGPKVHGKDQAKNILETNIDAAREICKQMRLRDMGGLIVIDFIDMDSDEHQEKVVSEFKKAIRRDSAPVSFSALSQFGLMEVTRKRVRANILTEKTDTCPCCDGDGFIYTEETLLSNIDRWLARCQTAAKYKEISLVISTEMVDVLMDNRALYFHYLNEKYSMKIELVENEDAYINEFWMIDTKNSEDITETYEYSK
ncbi:MAG: Rne/Rng family ribonuclease [Fibrobacterales bacterium]